ARTPLLRWIVQLAKDHAAAQERGVSPEQVQEERAEAAQKARLSRRQFLGVGAAAAATFALPRFARAGNPPRIAVIGGGISGLAAALALSDNGYGASTTVYEASGRIGGRMFSNSKEVNGTSYWDNDQVTEWCGELIDTSHTTIRNLATRFNLPL